MMQIDKEVVCLQYVIIDNYKAKLIFDIDLLVCDVHSFKIILNDLACAYLDINSDQLHKEYWHFQNIWRIKLSKRANRKEAKQYWEKKLMKFQNHQNCHI